MSSNEFILHNWEKEKIEQLDRYEEYKAGREEGIEQGIEKGIELGTKRGIDQTINKTIKVMLENNLEDSLISQITGKSIEEIETIKKNINS